MTRSENTPVLGWATRGVIFTISLCLLSGTAAWAGSPASSAKTDTSQTQKTPAKPADAAAKAGDGDAAADASFSYDGLVARAKALAAKDYTPPTQVPQFLRDLGADRWSKISYKRDDALWAKENQPFQVMFYPPGSFYDHAVKIHVIKDGKTQTFAFDKNKFDYPSKDLESKIPSDVGYAGFKVLYPLNSAKKMDEVISFLGASYFRALGADEHYGLSSRGLAIDTGDTNKGEEFPNFTDFWLVDPGKNAKQMTIYALLNSPSVTGAYKFVLKPGKATTTEVEETLFTRKAINKLGIAPLTSMFAWGENSLTRLDDYRPQAHDSDGMLISSADGEWLWRPLVNPQKLWINQFDADHVRGFGLIQRDRNFSDYQDLNYQYQKRPNAWIQPKGDWGKGHLELVEIPSDSEVNDNIDLYWVPAEPIKAGQRLHYAYDITWSSKNPSPASLGHTIASRIGVAAVVPGQKKSQIEVVLDFVGGELSKLKAPGSVQPRVNASRDVTINNIKAVPNPHTGGWRLSFLVPISDLDQPLNLRAYLAGANGGGLTETWNYLLAKP